MTIIDEVKKAIERNDNITRVIVSAIEYDQMLAEYVDLLPGGPLPEPDRQRWIRHAKYYGSFHIMGRPVEVRR